MKRCFIHSLIVSIAVNSAIRDSCYFKWVLGMYGVSSGLNLNVYFFDQSLVINSLNNHSCYSFYTALVQSLRGFYCVNVCLCVCVCVCVCVCTTKKRKSWLGAIKWKTLFLWSNVFSQSVSESGTRLSSQNRKRNLKAVCYRGQNFIKAALSNDVYYGFQ